MAQDNAFDGHSNGGYGWPPANSGHKAQNETTHATQVITAAAPYSTPLEFIRKYLAVPFLVLPELFKLGSQRRIAPRTN